VSGVRNPERTAPEEFKKYAGAIFSAENRFFPTWSAVMRLLSGYFCSSEKSRA
jgi:hypothetical protein